MNEADPLMGLGPFPSKSDTVLHVAEAAPVVAPFPIPSMPGDQAPAPVAPILPPSPPIVAPVEIPPMPGPVAPAPAPRIGFFAALLRLAFPRRFR